MNKNKRAGYGGDRSDSNQSLINAGGISKPFDVLNYRENSFFGQCQKCGSDYMKFSVNGFCQDCQQRVEFIVREHPHIAQGVRNQEQGAVQL